MKTGETETVFEGEDGRNCENFVICNDDIYVSIGDADDFATGDDICVIDSDGFTLTHLYTLDNVQRTQLYLVGNKILALGIRMYNNNWFDYDFCQCLIDKEGNVSLKESVCDIAIMPIDYYISGSYVLGYGKNTYYIDLTRDELNLCLYNLEDGVIIDSIGDSDYTELSAINGGYIYYQTTTGENSGIEQTIKGLKRHNINSGENEDIYIPPYSDGNRLVKIQAVIGNRIYGEYSSTSEKDYPYFEKTTIHRYDISNGELVEVAQYSQGEKTLQVNANGGLRLRSGPGTQYTKIVTIPNGTYITCLDEQDGWYNVRYGEYTGWVSGQYCIIQN